MVYRPEFPGRSFDPVLRPKASCARPASLPRRRVVGAEPTATFRALTCCHADRHTPLTLDAALSLAREDSGRCLRRSWVNHPQRPPGLSSYGDHLRPGRYGIGGGGVIVTEKTVPSPPRFPTDEPRCRSALEPDRRSVTGSGIESFVRAAASVRRRATRGRGHTGASICNDGPTALASGVPPVRLRCLRAASGLRPERDGKPIPTSDRLPHANTSRPRT